MDGADLQLARRSAAWKEFFTSFDANLAVTLVYNPTSGVAASTATGSATDKHAVSALSQGATKVPSEYRSISLARIHSDLEWLDYRIGRALCGTRFTKAPGQRRPSWIGCVEKLESHPHVHLLFRVNDDLVDEFTEHVSQLWHERCKSGTLRIKLIWSDGWAGYATKDQWGMVLEGDPRLFVCNPARK